MRVVVFSEYCFYRSPDGTLLSRTGTRGYSFWRRYLLGFDGVTVVARVADANSDEGELQSGEPVEGSGVFVSAVPSYRGLWQLIKHAPAVRAIVKKATEADSAFILRVPGMIGSLAHQFLRAQEKPYGLELVGDPYYVFAPGAVNHPLRPILRWALTTATTMQVRGAEAVAYVTERMLQARYPCDKFQTAISSVELPDEAIIANASCRGVRTRPFSLVTVGSLAQPYKGIDILIDAVALSRKAGVDLELKVVGDGKYRPSLEARANKLGVAEYVAFLGQLPAGQAVRDVLDSADVFVLASRTEGLPRALIEAMARALPCIGTRVGGIPELLPDEYLVPPNDAGALARKIQAIANADKSVLQAAGIRNLEVAKGYHLDILNERRKQFYRHIRKSVA